MKAHYTVAFAMLAGFSLGTVAVRDFMLRLRRLFIRSPKSISRIKQRIRPMSRRLRLRSRPLGGKSLQPEARSPRSKESRRSRALSFNNGTVWKNSKYTAIQRPSRISYRSARRWQNSAASSSRVCRSSLTNFLLRKAAAGLRLSDGSYALTLAGGR